MKLYIRQKVFSWVDRFTVTDETEAVRYTVEGEFLSLGKKLHVYDPQGLEAAYIQQKVLSFLPRYFVFVGGEQIADIHKEFTFFSQRYTVDGPDWTVSGDILAHDYEITDRSGSSVVTIHKAWLTWGDFYELDIAHAADETAALAVVLAIDCAIASAAAASRSADD